MTLFFLVGQLMGQRRFSREKIVRADNLQRRLAMSQVSPVLRNPLDTRKLVVPSFNKSRKPNLEVQVRD